MASITRTVIVRSTEPPKGEFRVFVELGGLYRNMVEQLVMHAVRNNITSFTKHRALKYNEMRKHYTQLPSHYVYTSC